MILILLVLILLLLLVLILLVLILHHGISVNLPFDKMSTGNSCTVLSTKL